MKNSLNDKFGTFNWPLYVGLSALVVALFFSSCHQDNKTTAEQQAIKTPDFNEDSAYNFVKRQVDFGPRVPGSKSHSQCAAYLQTMLKNYGWQVTLQTGQVKTYDLKQFNLKNIFAQYKPEMGNRVLLCTHWDTRFIADADTINKDKPGDGANDGASGVAVLLEIARQISILKPNIGVDIFFNDLEDYGQQDEKSDPYPKMEDSWCLGTQYWAQHPIKRGYSASYGILLDMVGGKNPVFPKEGSSIHYAPEIVEKVWNNAARIGYGSYFTNDQTGPTTDDHVYINEIAKIPCIDIVNMDINTGTYPAFHHTHSDNISLIDKNTLKMVGQVVLTTLLN